ncbi:hypothetical protein AB0L74_28820 [Streptomyces sp. NPDC052020]|uniref:hypothetical protein n=1 Tax=Streptomyces sp. NPDC052020 TaxID=3155677 RepID=UPI003412C11A
MVRSDALERERRLRRRSPGRIVLVTLIVVAALFLAWRVVVSGALEAHFGSGFDDRRFDEPETEFDHRKTAFAQADARMRELAAAHPRAGRIAWSLALICVRDAGRTEACEPTTARDQATYEALPGVDVIVRQSKDDGRTFFRFHGDDPPRYTIMHAPDGTDVARTAQRPRRVAGPFVLWRYASPRHRSHLRAFSGRRVGRSGRAGTSGTRRAPGEHRTDRGSRARSRRDRGRGTCRAGVPPGEEEGDRGRRSRLPCPEARRESSGRPAETVRGGTGRPQRAEGPR